MTDTHLTPRQVDGVFIEVVNVGAERLEVRDDKLLPEGLGEQNDVALDASGTGDIEGGAVGVVLDSGWTPLRVSRYRRGGGNQPLR